MVSCHLPLTSTSVRKKLHHLSFVKVKGQGSRTEKAISQVVLFNKMIFEKNLLIKAGLILDINCCGWCRQRARERGGRKRRETEGGREGERKSDIGACLCVGSYLFLCMCVFNCVFVHLYVCVFYVHKPINLYFMCTCVCLWQTFCVIFD